jgi:hypothetical protein
MTPKRLELPISAEVSTETPHGMPADRKSLTGGRPKPIRRSEVVAMLIVAPVSFTILSS